MRASLAILLLVAAAGCAGEGPAPSQAPPQEGSGPYVVSAIDYHFHDAHPSARIALDRAVAFDNDGRNIHNVTFEDVRYSENFRPGERLVIRPGKLFTGPGAYRFVCSFHADRKMTGVLLMVEPEG